jgi:hypothetical protein
MPVYSPAIKGLETIKPLHGVALLCIVVQLIFIFVKKEIIL